MFGLVALEVELLADTLEVLNLREIYLLKIEFDVGNRYSKNFFRVPGIPSYLNGMVALEERWILPTHFTRRVLFEPRSLRV
jgi:hypothetical protein